MSAAPSSPVDVCAGFRRRPDGQAVMFVVMTVQGQAVALPLDQSAALRDRLLAAETAARASAAAPELAMTAPQGRA